MNNCNHEWIITEWAASKKPYRRYCKKCGKKQKISYLGGNLWEWEDVFPPKHLYFDEDLPKKQVKTFKISEKNANTIKYALILAVLLTTLYAFMSFKQGNIMSFFGSQTFVYVAVSYVFIYICWQGITNRLPRFPIEIVKSPSKSHKHKPIQPLPSFLKRTSFFSMVGYTLSMAFTVMIMIFLAVAHLSGTGETRVIWNHFGEMTIETALFVVAFVFVIIGFYYTYQRFKHEIRQF